MNKDILRKIQLFLTVVFVAIIGLLGYNYYTTGEFDRSYIGAILSLGIIYVLITIISKKK